MTYIVIYDNCQEGNDIFIFDEADLNTRFDNDDTPDQEIQAKIREYIENLEALDGQYGGSVDIPDRLEGFLESEFVEENRHWQPVESKKKHFLSGYFKIIETGWLA